MLVGKSVPLLLFDHKFRIKHLSKTWLHSFVEQNFDCYRIGFELTVRISLKEEGAIIKLDINNNNIKVEL